MTLIETAILHIGDVELANAQPPPKNVHTVRPAPPAGRTCLTTLRIAARKQADRGLASVNRAAWRPGDQLPLGMPVVADRAQDPPCRAGVEVQRDLHPDGPNRTHGRPRVAGS